MLTYELSDVPHLVAYWTVALHTATVEAARTGQAVRITRRPTMTEAREVIMDDVTRMKFVTELMNQAEQLMRLADQMQRPPSERTVDLQGVADAIRDAGQHAMQSVILAWVRRALERFAPGDIDRRDVQEWFQTELANGEKAALLEMRMAQQLFQMDRELIERRAVTEWPGDKP